MNFKQAREFRQSEKELSNMANYFCIATFAAVVVPSDAILLYMMGVQWKPSHWGTPLVLGSIALISGAVIGACLESVRRNAIAITEIG